MKTILCYGDSNVRGASPLIDEKTGFSKRYTKTERWTGILQNLLGSEYEIIEEGMNGRTTIFNDIPERPYRNGLTQLPVCLESHYPIDLVILMLGTNDIKTHFNASANKIAEGMSHLIKVIKDCQKGPLLSAPKILLISPAVIIKAPGLLSQFDEMSIEKSKALAEHYQQLAKNEKCDFLDAAQIITSSKIDGIHIDKDQCALLGHAVAEKVMEIF